MKKRSWYRKSEERSNRVREHSVTSMALSTSIAQNHCDDRALKSDSAKQVRESKQSMASVLYQSIELLSQEKGIEPGIVVGAVEEAIALATRKFYKTQENMRGELNKETGEITAYIYKTVVADDEPDRRPAQPDHAHRSQRTGSRRRGGQRDPPLSRHQPSGPHRRTVGQAGHLPEGPRS